MCHRGKPISHCIVNYVAIKKRSELLHHRMVDFLTGHKLPVVEPQTVVEQKLNVAHDKLLRVLVDTTMELFVYHVENSAEDVYLATRKM